jgi:signal transduction histidine kinase
VTVRGRLRLTVRLRLTLLYGGLFLAAGVALLAIDYALLRANLPDRQVQASTGEDVLNYARKALTDPRLSPADRALANKIVTGSPAEAAAIAAHPERVAGGRGWLSSFLNSLPHTVHAVRNQALDQLLHQSEIALGLMALVSVGLGWLVAGRALRPLAGITATARRLSAEHLDQRIGMRGPADELKELADTFDQMLDRLEAAFASQRRFVASASHELRTPLTIMRTELDMTLRRPQATAEQLRRMGQVALDAVVRSDQLVESLLLLASADHPVQATRPVDLTEAVNAALERQRAEIAGRRLRVTTELVPAVVDGDPVLLASLVDNLVANAVRHNLGGGWLHASTAAEGDQARLVVASSGPVVPADRVEDLFEPFQRLDGDRVRSQRGAGLGLSIVRTVALAHHGHVNASPLDAGGLRVTVTLPGSSDAGAPTPDSHVTRQADHAGPASHTAPGQMEHHGCR